MMPRKIKIIATGLFVLFTILKPETARVFAQEESVSMKPAEMILSAKPNDNLTEVYKLVNYTSHIAEITFRTHVIDETPKNTALIESWISYDPTVVQIAPGDFAFVNVVIEIPEGAEPRPHYVTIEGGVKYLSNEENPRVVNIPGYTLSSQLVLRVAGKINESASVTEFRPSPLINEKLPVNLGLNILNSSNVEINPYGIIKLQNRLTGEVSHVDLPATNILPGQQKTINILIEKQIFWGLYQAVLEAHYGLNHQPLTATTAFLYIPVTLISLYIFAFALCVVLIYWILHHLTRVRRAMWDLTHDEKKKRK